MKKYLIILGAFLLLPFSVKAASANIDFTSSNKNAGVGNTINVTATVSSSSPIGYYEYTLDYDNEALELIDGNPYNVERSNNDNTKNFKKEFKFKILKSGNLSIGAKSYAVTTYKDDDNMSVTINPLKISSSSVKQSASTNNNLSSLSIEGYKISPTFSKDNTNYVLKIEDDISEINVLATASDSRSTIKGDGKRVLADGENKIEVIVTSQSGSEKTYTITVTLVEKNPIKVKVGGVEYTVLRTLGSLEKPNGYKEVKIKIKEKDISALTSDKTGLTLVGLKDKDGNASLFIYDKDENSYYKYSEISIGKLTIVPLKPSKKPYGYEIYTETINGEEIDCYKLSGDSNYSLIYGLNTETGKKNWYSYDNKENTLQIYNFKVDDFYKDKINSTKTLIYILSGTTLLFGIVTIALAIKKSKKR